jgi:hypothetical protein
MKHQLCTTISSSSGSTNKAQQKFLTSSTSKAKLQYRVDSYKIPHLQQYLQRYLQPDFDRPISYLYYFVSNSLTITQLILSTTLTTPSVKKPNNNYEKGIFPYRRFYFSFLSVNPYPICRNCKISICKRLGKGQSFYTCILRCQAKR